MGAINNYIEVFNNNSNVVINDNYKNFHLVKTTKNIKREVSKEYYFNDVIKENDIFYYHEGTSIAVCRMQIGDDELLAVKSSYPDLCVTAQRLKDKIEFKFKTDTEEDFNKKVDSLSLYTFSNRVLDNNSHGVGVQIFNKNGEVIFNSNEKYLKVLDFINEDTSYREHKTKRYGKEIAVIILNTSNGIRYHQPEYNEFFADGVSFEDSKSFSISTVPIYRMQASDPSTALDGIFSYTSLLVIDVTGL